MRPLALAFYGVFAIAALWHAPRSIEATLARHASPAPPQTLALEPWWTSQWTQLPAQRTETDPMRQWALDIQYAGSAGALQQHLQTKGWRVQPQAGWVAVLGLLDDDRAPVDQAVLPATLDGRPEALLMRRVVGPNDVYVLRLWLAPRQLQGGTPLWIGATQQLHYARPLKVFGVWRPVADEGAAHAQLRKDVAGWPQAETPHPDGKAPVLRVRER
jgi:hypothetical protein